MYTDLTTASKRSIIILEISYASKAKCECQLRELKKGHTAPQSDVPHRLTFIIFFITLSFTPKQPYRSAPSVWLFDFHMLFYDPEEVVFNTGFKGEMPLFIIGIEFDR